MPFDADARLRSLALASARTGLRAVTLGTSDVLLAGGTGTDGTPSTALELYTPR